MVLRNETGHRSANLFMSSYETTELPIQASSENPGNSRAAALLLMGNKQTAAQKELMWLYFEILKYSRRLGKVAHQPLYIYAYKDYISILHIYIYK